jgi:hypothetical protein
VTTRLEVGRRVAFNDPEHGPTHGTIREEIHPNYFKVVFDRPLFNKQVIERLPGSMLRPLNLLEVIAEAADGRGIG